MQDKKNSAVPVDEAIHRLLLERAESSGRTVPALVQGILQSALRKSLPELEVLVDFMGEPVAKPAELLWEFQDEIEMTDELTRDLPEELAGEARWHYLDEDVFPLETKHMQAAWTIWSAAGLESAYEASKEEFSQSWRQSMLAYGLHHKGRLVAIGRAISDGVLCATLLDLVVHPAYEGKGLGNRLARSLVEELLERGLSTIHFTAAREQIGYFQGLGFRLQSGEAPGMVLKA